MKAVLGALFPGLFSRGKRKGELGIVRGLSGLLLVAEAGDSGVLLRLHTALCRHRKGQVLGAGAFFTVRAA